MTNPIAQDLGGVVRLLDCPGCGHPVDQDECPYPSGSRTSVDGRAMYAVNCVNNECGWQARGWGADGARKAWNTRAHSAEIAGALEQLRDLHDSIRTVYDAVPALPITADTVGAATDALHAFCLLVGIHRVDVGDPQPQPAMQQGSGGGE
jgi:hypothetical protein